jgi:hypothetical protein
MFSVIPVEEHQSISPSKIDFRGICQDTTFWVIKNVDVNRKQRSQVRVLCEPKEGC